eukprot:12419233-Karenia_brevis.AAC.1
MDQAINKKHRDYRDIVAFTRCKLVVCAMETGGLWHREGYDLLRHLAKAKARAAGGRVRQPTQVV